VASYLVSALPVILSVLVLATNAVSAEENVVSDQFCKSSTDDSIVLEGRNATLSQVLDSISDKTGVEIIWRGTIPPTIADYSLRAKSISGLLEKTMQLFNINSFVTTRQIKSGELAAIEVIGFDVSSNAPSVQNGFPEVRKRHEESDGALSEKQRRALLELDAEFNESTFGTDGRLTDNEKRLVKEFDEVRSVRELAESGRLNEERLEMVKERSFWIEREEREYYDLTPAQLKHLRIDSRRIEKELENSSKPLAEDQVQKLRAKER
jgi:hypothetical protein